MTGDENFEAIFTASGSMSDREIGCAHTKLTNLIDEFCDDKIKYYHNMQSLPQEAFNRIMEIKDDDLADRISKLSVKNDDDNVLLDLFFNFIVSPLAGYVLRNCLEKLLKAQFFSRLLTTSVKHGSNLEERISRLPIDFENKSDEEINKLIKTNFKADQKSIRNRKIRNWIKEDGMDMMETGVQNVSSQAPNVQKTGQAAKAAQVHIADTANEHTQYFLRQQNFYTDYKTAFHKLLFDVCYNTNDKNRRATLKKIKIAFEEASKYHIGEINPNDMNNYGDFIEALYWSLLYEGVLFTMTGVKTEMIHGEKYPIGLYKLDRDEYKNDNMYEGKTLKPIVGEKIIEYLLKNFPHVGYENHAFKNGEKFNDYVYDTQNPQLAYLMMDEYFSSFNQYIPSDLITVLQRALDAAKKYVPRLTQSITRGIFPGR